MSAGAVRHVVSAGHHVVSAAPHVVSAPRAYTHWCQVGPSPLFGGKSVRLNMRRNVLLMWLRGLQYSFQDLESSRSGSLWNKQRSCFCCCFAFPPIFTGWGGLWDLTWALSIIIFCLNVTAAAPGGTFVTSARGMRGAVHYRLPSEEPVTELWPSR